MKLQVLCCEVFFREICLLAASSPHTIDLAFLPKGLHDLGVERMVPRLQEQIDAVPAGEYDAIVLVYGLCNNGIVGLQARDTTAGFRLYHDYVLRSIPLDQVFSNGYSFLVEMLFMCQRRGWQIGEVPIKFEDRRKGTTKISRGEVFKAQYTVLRLLARRLLAAPRPDITDGH